jgi:hypothetical protein
MSSITISLIVLGCVFGGVFGGVVVGILLRAVLPQDHLSADSQGTLPRLAPQNGANLGHPAGLQTEASPAPGCASLQMLRTFLLTRSSGISQ